MSKPWGRLHQIFMAFSEYISFKGHYRNQGLKVILVTKCLSPSISDKYCDIIFVAVTRFKRIHHDWCSKLFSCFKGKTFLAVKCLKVSNILWYLYIRTAFYFFYLTLIGMSGDTSFHSLSFLDQICQLNLKKKIQTFLEVKPAMLIEFYKKCP